MRERPILFSGPMVQAILDGRKTVTRRVVGPPRGWGERYPNCDPYSMPPSVWWWDGVHDHVGVRQECPYGVPGDRLWVRETHLVVGGKHSTSPRVVYKATNNGPDAWLSPAWAPSIHMPRWASRLTLEVVSVRVERVQDVSHDDAVSEGMSAGAWRYGDGAHRRSPFGSNAVKRFAILWDELNFSRGYGWDANPWVWRIEFRRVMPNASLSGARALLNKTADAAAIDS